MQRIFWFLLALFLPALPALAEMSAEQFEAYVTGQTLTYADGGVVYGVEEYLPGRRVRWAFNGDRCKDGHWYEAGGQICFIYDDNPDAPQCWLFSEQAGRLSAVFTGSAQGRQLFEAVRRAEPLLCLGPEVGV
ncbi:MAG: hypothetical protein GY717_04470 [Rhodobacteraceae bacterium]|nr:hypothetical protein [Paracoccaceae bacterium]